MVDAKKINYEIELMLNQNLFEKKIITEDLYNKVKEKLLNLINNLKSQN